MSYNFDDYTDLENEYPRYVSVAERRQRARDVLMERTALGEELQPIVAPRRGQLAKSFWGKAWCLHIASFEDFAHRLDSGRSYLRTGAVIDLNIAANQVKAKVVGGEVYDVVIDFAPLADEKWQSFIEEQANSGLILVDLLAGTFSDKIQESMINPHFGLFPNLNEINFSCDCLDDADLCKHIGAVLYGLSIRLDDRPEEFFSLRGVDPVDIIDAGYQQKVPHTANDTTDWSNDALETVFGIEIERGDDEIDRRQN